MIFNNNNTESVNDDIDDFIQGQVAKKHWKVMIMRYRCFLDDEDGQ